VSEATIEPGLLELIAPESVAYWTHLGIQVESAERGHVRLSLEMRDELGTRLPGIMHGGAVGSLIDSAAGAATSTLREADDETWGGQATTDMNATFLAAATGRVVAEATVLRSSRSFSFVQVEVRAEDETLVAVGRATYTIIRKRS
jgi:uncharacterized protein (TIGR00369 family)